MKEDILLQNLPNSNRHRVHKAVEGHYERSSVMNSNTTYKA